MLQAISSDMNDFRAICTMIREEDAIDEGTLHLLGPSSELFVHNPFSARIAFRALAKGRRFAHHELRGYIPVPEDMEPEISVWEYDSNIPLWVGGVRRNPKHFCFRLDAVFPTFHPNYRSKWPAHELLHSLCGYYWHPEQTRFDCYVGARLAELLPLTHWYGLDEVGRERCTEHQGRPPTKEYCAQCEALFGAYWNVEWTPSQEEHAQKALKFAFAYFREEREACLREIETTKRHAIPRVLLDSSSDALGYLEGHWNRLCSWSFGAFDDLFVRAEERHDSLDGFLEHIDSLFKGLFQEGVPHTPQEIYEEQYQVRRIQDIGKRVLMALEWGTDLDRNSCWPLLVQAADSVHHHQPFDVDTWIKELDSCIDKTTISPIVTESLFHTGLRNDSWSPSIVQGLEQSFACDFSTEEIKGIVESPIFWSLGHLWKRVPQIVDNDESGIEGWLKNRPHEDQEARLFSMPFSSEEGTLRLNSTFRRGRFSVEAMESVLGWSEAATIVACWSRGEPIVLVMDDQLKACIGAVEEGSWREKFDLSYIEELVSIGLLVWIPQGRD